MENQNYEKKGYLLEDFRLFHLHGAQGVKAEYHYHEFCKLLLLVSGTGGYSVEGQRYGLQPGDIVLVGSRAVHRPEFDPNAPYERIIVYIDPEFLQRHSSADCNLLDVFSSSKGHVLRCGRQQLFHLAGALEKELARTEYGWVILSEGILLRLLVEIAREQSKTHQQIHPLIPRDRRITDLMAYIQSHIAEDISIDQLAQQCYLSKYHLMRLFRAETGQSIYHYLTQQRLLKARELSGSGMLATEAAFRCGFSTYSSFVRSYSKHYGATPTGRTRNSNRLEETYE